MKKINLLFVLAIFTITTKIQAEECLSTLSDECTRASVNGNLYYVNTDFNNCERGQTLCLWAHISNIYYEFNTCYECPPGYTKKTEISVYPQDGTGWLCDDTLDYGTCECICAEPCNGHEWRNVPGTGYQDFVTNSCLCDINGANCNPQTQYRCAAGYYGKPTTNTEPICNKCPDMPTDANMQVKNPGQSDLGNNEDITDCYQPSDKVFEDDVGTYTFANKCNNTGK